MQRYGKKIVSKCFPRFFFVWRRNFHVLFFVTPLKCGVIAVCRRFAGLRFRTAAGVRLRHAERDVRTQKKRAVGHAQLDLKHNADDRRTKGSRHTLCRERDSNPHSHFWPRDFKSLVSTNSTIAASLSKIIGAPFLLHCFSWRLQQVIMWSGKRDSDPRPQPWQGCALPTELFPLVQLQ